MARMDLNETFIPTLTSKLGEGEFITAKFAIGGEPIIKWVKKENDTTNHPDAGLFHEGLNKEIKKAIDGEKIGSVTFVWMQGERDARNKDGNNIELYQERFMNILKQFEEDFGFTDINVVIGRINDCSKSKKWNSMRATQATLVDSLPKARLVNTDDLNTGIQLDKGELVEVTDNIHLTVEGYKTFGTRLADAALEMLGN